MKTFVLTVSRTFPATHKRKGEETHFVDKILAHIKPDGKNPFGWMNFKIHTIRSNYDFWAKRIEKVQKGEAVISVRYWSGKPYHKDDNGIGQVEICQLGKDSGIGVQKIKYSGTDRDWFNWIVLRDEKIFYNIGWNELAKNDGLTLDDFKEWFKNYDLSKSMAIIHFTPMRY